MLKKLSNFMHKDRLILSCFCVFFCSFYSFHAFAVTKIIFSNNTNNNYEITSQLLDTSSNLRLGHDYHTVDTSPVEAYLSNQQVLEFNSNVNIKNGREYHFTVDLFNKTYPTQSLTFYITTKGLFTGSKITETYLILTSGEKINFNPQQPTFLNIATNNTTIRFVPYMRTDNTVSWPSFVIAMDQAYNDPFDFSQANTFKGMSYNVQLWPFYGDTENPPNNKYERAYRIPKLISNNYDYVTLHEVFDYNFRAQIINDMSEYYPYFVDAPGLDGINALSGGVVTFSKWPILEAKQLVYKSCDGIDCLANKGATYIKILKRVDGIEQKYNIFSTHLQAGRNHNETNSYEQPRAKQLRELKQFIDAQNIPASEPVLIAGDLNISKFNESVENYTPGYPQIEYNYLLNTLNASNPIQTGLKYSTDYFLNTMLGLSSRGKSHVDYILYLNDHKVPVNAVNDVRPFRDTSNSNMYPIYDMSDHFPVIGEFVF